MEQNEKLESFRMRLTHDVDSLQKQCNIYFLLYIRVYIYRDLTILYI